MIQFLRKDNMSIWLYFNLVDLELMTNCFNKVINGGKESINALMDMSVVTLKKKSKEMEVSVRIRLGVSTEIYKQEHGKVLWLFDKEDLEDAIGRLEQCKSEGYFSPAEFIRVKVPKNKKLDYIYCELKGA